MADDGRLSRGRNCCGGAGVPDAAFDAPGVAGVWSVRDVLAYFVAHEQRALAEVRLARHTSPHDPGSYAISLIVVITERQVGKIGRNSALPRLDEVPDGAV